MFMNIFFQVSYCIYLYIRVESEIHVYAMYDSQVCYYIKRESEKRVGLHVL